MKLTDRELATILAALRFWQDYRRKYDRTVWEPPISKELHAIATAGRTIPMLKTDEIDALCERLNCEG